LLTALVPFLSGIFLKQTFDLETPPIENKYYNTITYDPAYFQMLVFFILASFAFFLNLVREIIKDVEDVEGDRVLKAKTIPIVLGERKARIISLILIIFILVFSFLGLYFFTQILLIHPRFVDYILFGVIAFFLFLAIFFLKSPERKQLKYADRSLKVAMIIGSLLPMIWSLIVVKV
jgi:4-hydroxybenzoate polyprenyltransferase